MNPYLELVRPSICLLSVFGLIVGLLLTHTPINLWFFPILSVLLISASGNIINDYFDFEIDKINKPKRPLPSKRISKKRALIFYIILDLFGLIFSTLTSLNFFFLAILNSVLSFIYSLKLKRTIFGNMVDSWLACSVFIAPVLISGGLIEIIKSSATILAVISFFGNYGREVLKDVEDIKGDAVEKVKTLPLVVGKYKAILFGKFMILIGSILLFLPYLLKMFGIFYLLSTFFCFFICVYILTNKDVSVVQKRIKFFMFIVILCFLMSIILE